MEAVSKSKAALAAGVCLSTLERWVLRSRERRADDAPWVWEIAEIWDRSAELQSARAKDVAWHRAMVGVDKPVVHQGVIKAWHKVPDNSLLLRFVESGDAGFRSQGRVEHAHAHVHVADEGLREGLTALARLAGGAAEHARTGGVMEGGLKIVDAEEVLPLESEEES